MLTIKLAAVRFAMFVCAIAGLILMLYALAQIGEQGVAWLKTGEWGHHPVSDVWPSTAIYIERMNWAGLQRNARWLVSVNAALVSFVAGVFCLFLAVWLEEEITRPRAK
jgi:hypothetical protein